MDFIIIFVMICALCLAFGIGSNDETMSSVVGSGTLSLNKAVIWGGLLSCLGCILFSDNVVDNIGANLLDGDLLAGYNFQMMVSIILGASIWLIIASKSGAPISTTHSVVGAVMGVAFIWSFIPGNDFLYAMNWTKLGTVALGWIISPIFGMIAAYLMQSLVKKIISYQWKKKGTIGFSKIESTERITQYFLLLFISMTQLFRGGNDSANVLGVFYLLIQNGELGTDMALILKVMTGLMMALGVILIGRNVIKNVGGSLIEMRPTDAFAIESANAVVVFSCNMLGFPISGSHVLIFAYVGSGLVKGEKANWKVLKRMISIWLITFPAAALISGAFYFITLLIF